VTTALLEVERLTVSLSDRSGHKRTVIGDVSFRVAPGEALGVVGESGSGKSLSMLALLQLLPEGASASAEYARFDGRELLHLSADRLNSLRGREIAIVFQDPLAALNPVLTVGRQISEVIRRHFRVGQAEALRRAERLLVCVGISDPTLRLRQYPHQLSGGMRQRVTIAMALAGEPRILIADEPTTALDVTLQAEIVSLIQALQRQTGMSVIWVTHDMALLARIADRILVMYGGRVVEEASAERVFGSPRHPYTQALLSNLTPDAPVPPGGASGRGDPERVQAGAAPADSGCPFAPRCVHATAHCSLAAPTLTSLEAGVRVACWAVSAGPERTPEGLEGGGLVP
jgi:oligopeptide transport system ATP-binding protein